MVRTIQEFTEQDFLEGTAPYEYLFEFKDDTFRLERELTKLCKVAAKFKIKNFKKMFQEYVKKQKELSGLICMNNITQFENQPMELLTGNWKADEYGITIDTPYGEKIACPHPIMPVLRLVNIDTGVEKLQLVYRKGKQWRNIIVDRKTIASNNSIISLADFGVGVTSENSKLLVQYLHDIENLNYDLITEKNSVSRLGWIDGAGFSPYVEDLVFDGELCFKAFFDSVQEKGDLGEWLLLANKVRKDSTYARIILAASFASVLVQPLGCLPFFVHLWGGTETGKTVGLMLAASVWANPEMGKYIHTFNSTNVGREKSAGFVNSLPLIFDELQIIADKKSFDNEIYMLSEGIGRSRGAKTGGVQRLETWRNCMITSGEMPITTISSGGGAVNRIIEIECQERIFKEPHDVANTIRKNYGFAGKIFVEQLQKNGNLQYAERLFKEFYSQAIGKDATEKQSMAAALILTADTLATEWIFEDHMALTIDEISEFLQSKATVSPHQRAYEYLCEYVVVNKNKFCGRSEYDEVWGAFEGNFVYIARNIFNMICSKENFNPQALLSWLKKNGKIDAPNKGFSKAKRINGEPCNCVCLQVKRYNDVLLDEKEEKPFG